MGQYCVKIVQMLLVHVNMMLPTHDVTDYVNDGDLIQACRRHLDLFQALLGVSQEEDHGKIDKSFLFRYVLVHMYVGLCSEGKNDSRIRGEVPPC
jgi:hypothetical protein